MKTGISTNKPISKATAACLKSAGVSFVFRYYAKKTKDPEKRLTSAESVILLSAGLDIGIVFENGGAATYGYFTQARGAADGADAVTIAHGLGQPTGTGIYFAADLEIKPSQMKTMSAYFAAVKIAMESAGGGTSPYAIGVYGSGLLCAGLLNAGLVTLTWLSESMGFIGSKEFEKSNRWNVKQSLAQKNLCGLKGSNNPDTDDYEDNEAQDSFGAWNGNLTHSLVLAKTLTGAGAPPAIPPQPPQIKKVRTVADGVSIYQLANKAVYFTSKMSVDADGCPLAYHKGDTGLDALKNASDKHGNLSPNVIVMDKNGDPVIQGAGASAPGYYVSMTALASAGAVKNPGDPKNYADALSIPYIVIPGGGAGAARLGNPVLVIDLTQPGHMVKAIVADVGPKTETGEASMYCAGLISGVPPAQITESLARKSKSVINPRNGGPNGTHFRYIIYTGTTLTLPVTVAQINDAVDQARAQLTPEENAAIES